MSIFDWVGILVLIVINALYVAAEFSAVSVRRGQIRQLAQSGSATARRLLPILDSTRRLDDYVAACQIGITLSSLVLGAFGQARIAVDLAGMLQSSAGMTATAAISTAAVTILIVLTVLQVVFGELVPKSLALQFSTRVALWTYLPMRWSLVLFRPFIAFLNGSGSFLLRLLGADAHGSHRHIHSPEEIEMLIVESSDGGLLEPEERSRLRHALQIGQRSVHDLMVPRRRVQFIDASLTLEEGLRVAIASPFTRLPVFRDSQDNVIGMLHTKDLVHWYTGRSPAPPTTTIDNLIRPIEMVPSNLSGDQLLDRFRESRSRFALAIDEHGGVDGIVTLEDVLDELLGEVADEFKGDQQPVVLLEGGRLRVSGEMRLEDLEEHLSVELRRAGVTTVAGMLLDMLARVPSVGDAVVYGALRFEVEVMERQAITSVLVTQQAPSNDAARGATEHGALPTEAP